MSLQNYQRGMKDGFWVGLVLGWVLGTVVLLFAQWWLL